MKCTPVAFVKARTASSVPLCAAFHGFVLLCAPAKLLRGGVLARRSLAAILPRKPDLTFGLGQFRIRVGRSSNEDRPLKLTWGIKPRWLAAGLVLAVGLWCCRRPLLTLAARPLIADEPPADADCVCIFSGVDHRYEVAAGLYREKPMRRIVLLEPEASRLVRLGILPSGEAIARRELAARRVPQDPIVVIGRGSRGVWQGARQIAHWLQQQRTTCVAVLVDRFESARQRQIFEAVLGHEDAQRVRIVALPHRDYNETDWWQSRVGAREFMLAWLRRGYTAWMGESAEPPPSFEPDDYDRLVARARTETRP
mgnify:FL=1